MAGGPRRDWIDLAENAELAVGGPGSEGHLRWSKTHPSVWILILSADSINHNSVYAVHARQGRYPD